MRMYKPEIMPLEEVLLQVRTWPLLLDVEGIPWTPNTYVPRRIRQAVKAHHFMLRRMIAQGDVRTCAAPWLHRPYWSYREKQYTCDLCRRIAV